MKTTKFKSQILIIAALFSFLQINVVATNVYSGGVNSISARNMQDMANGSNSSEYRKFGGGLYAHEVGWIPTSEENKKRISKLFPNNVIYETGRDQCVGSLELNIKKYWPNGAYVAGVTYLYDPDADSKKSIQRAKEVREETQRKVLAKHVGPVFSPNIPEYFSIPWENSKWDTLREIAKIGGAMVLDSPPVLYNGIEEYKTYSKKQIRWCRENNIVSVVILHPGWSKDFWKDTKIMVNDLRKDGAEPDVYAVENYYDEADPMRNIHPIGNENNPNHLMYTAKNLAKFFYSNKRKLSKEYLESKDEYIDSSEKALEQNLSYNIGEIPVNSDIASQNEQKTATPVEKEYTQKLSFFEKLILKLRDILLKILEFFFK